AYPKNLWLLARVTTQAEADARIPHLLRVPAAVRGVAVVPREGIDLREFQPFRMSRSKPGLPSLCDLRGAMAGTIDWVTCSGDTDPVHPDWMRALRDQCQAAGVPFWFDSWGEWDWNDGQGVLFGSDGQFCPTDGPILCTRTDRDHLHSFV